MKLSFSTTFHPQINGQTKRFNGVLNQYLRNNVSADQKDWGKHLGLMKFCYNSTMHLETKMSPFELTLGKEVRKLWKWSKSVKKNTFEPKSFWSRLKNGTKSMPLKYEGIWS
jgi:hypothetical protein